MGLKLTMANAMVLASALANAAVIPEGTVETPGFYMLSARKYRGTTMGDAEVNGQPHVLLKRDGDGYLNMGLQNENTFYMAEIEIGSTNQKVGVLVDTGSSDLWVVVESNNTYCESGTTGSLSSKRVAPESIFDRNQIDSEGNIVVDEVEQNTNKEVQIKASSSSSSIDCSVYGTFDPSDSTTFSSNNTQFAITYADSTFAKGYWATDNIVISGTTVESLSFAVCDNTDNAMGVFGIGLSGLETTYSGSLVSTLGTSYTYENLPIRLKTLGITNSVSYSVYLNDTDASDANILFGALDHARYSGDLVTLPLVNSQETKSYSKPIELQVTLNSVSIGGTNDDVQTQIASGAAAALLDTGTTLTYMPPSVLQSALNALDVKYSSSISGYVTDCSNGSNTQITFNFQGQEITVPLSSFLVSLTTTSGSSSSYCMVGILSSGTGSTDFILGDSFLRYVYLVADLENYNVALAQAEHGNSDTNIETISGSIPSAISPSTTATYGGSNTVMNAVSGLVTNSAGGSTTSTSTSKGKKTTSTSSTGTATGTSSTSVSVSTISTSTQKAAAGSLQVSYGLSLAALAAALI